MKRYRLIIASIVLSTLCVSIGCTHFGITNSEWRGRSILPDDHSIAELNAIANNPTNSQSERAIAVFKLFAHHISPGSSAKDVHRVLTDTSWQEDISLSLIQVLGGVLPVEWTDDNSAFVIYLFPERGPDYPWSPWVIYMCLSGTRRTAEDASDFMDGDTTLPGDCRLDEFALSFPDVPVEGGGGSTIGRCEVFSRKGIRVGEDGYPIEKLLDAVGSKKSCGSTNDVKYRPWSDSPWPDLIGHRPTTVPGVILERLFCDRVVPDTPPSVFRLPSSGLMSSLSPVSL